MDKRNDLSRNPNSQHSSSSYTRGRQFKSRLGSNPHPQSIHFQFTRNMVRIGEGTTHKHQRVIRGSKILRESTRRDQKHAFSNSQRQQDNHSHSCETRIKQIGYPTRNHNKDSSRTNKEKLYIRNSSHSRQTDGPCRFLIKTQPPHADRNSTISPSLSKPNVSLRNLSRSRSLRDKVQQEKQKIPFLNPRSSSRDSKHIHHELVQVPATIRLSPSEPNTQDFIQVAEGETGNPSVDSAKLANQVMVFTTTEDESQESQNSPTRSRSFHNNEERKTILSGGQIPLNRTSVIRNHIPQAFSKSLKKKLIKTNKTTTEDHYQIHWRKFITYLKSKKLPLSNHSVYEFFNHLIDKNLAYSSLLQYRSGISKPLKYLLPKLDLIQDSFMKALLQYTKSHNIKIRNKFPFWNLDKILEMFTSTQFKNLCKKNTNIYFKKVIFLILLASPRRISEFQALSLTNSSIDHNEVILRTHSKFIKKNASATFNPLDIKIPSHSENLDICPVHNLHQYLQITEKICLNKNISRPDQIFIKEDTRPFTTHQLRSSVREIIIRADPLAPKQSSTFHSVRKIASTLLDYRGYSLAEIMESMQWHSSQTYLKYYCQLGLVNPTSKSCIIAGRKLPST